eukprot:gene2503-3096_t
MVIKTKINALYNPRFCQGIIPLLSRNVVVKDLKYPQVNVHHFVADLAGLEQFNSVQFKGMFSSAKISIQLIATLLQAVVDLNSFDPQLILNFMIDKSTTTTPPKINSTESSPTLNSQNLSTSSSNINVSKNSGTPPIPPTPSPTTSTSDFNTIDKVHSSFKQVFDFIISCQKNDSDRMEPYYDNVLPKEEGAFIYSSCLGPVQIGVPPETIKTSMKKNEIVPQIYILPHILCSKGVSYSEVEFPVYFNFFINKAATNPNRRVIMIGNSDQLKRVRSIFKESMFGPNPDQIYIPEEISEHRLIQGYQIDFPAERATLAFTKSGQEASLDDFVIFRAYDENDTVVINQPKDDDNSITNESVKSLKIVNRRGLVCFYENDQLKGLVDSTCEPQSTPKLHYTSSPLFRSNSTNKFPFLNSSTNRAALVSPYIQGASSMANIPGTTNNSPPPQQQVYRSTNMKFTPPTLGITFLGTSHGFDVHGSTTGFILWINGNGVLVDPPVGTTTYLYQHGLAGKMVEHVILTHCHSDHDSGILQKIIESNKITLYTTRTINESYQRKARALTGIENIGDFYHWVPVKIGQPIKIQGAEFEFDYSYHTIPTIRFKLRIYGKSISYSSDTKYCPSSLQELVQQGVINNQRETSLRMFVFDSDVIIHECGVPPIHTTVEALNDLTDSIKKKLLVVHTSKLPDKIERKNKDGSSSFVKVTGLNIPKVGLENTINVPVGDYYEGYSKAVKRSQLLCNSFYFRNMPPSMINRLFYALKEEKVSAGTKIINAGEECDKCYLIESGIADVIVPSKEDRELIEKHLPYSLDHSNPGVVDQFFAGETFGEGALWKDKIRSATVVAKTDMNLLSISNQDFHTLHAQYCRGEVLQSLSTDLEKISMFSPFLHRVLSKIFPFSQLQLTKEQVDTIASSIESQMTFDTESTIIKEGDNDESMYIIEEGTVKLIKNGSTFKTLGQGECFGEISMILGLPRTCTAIASPGTRLLILKREGFQKILDRYQNIKYSVVHLMEERLTQGTFNTL